MFTESEVETLSELEKIKTASFELKKDFIKTEAPYLEISDTDFFSLILLAPTVGVAMADDSLSFWEEMALNKKARKLSKGGYFLKKDPIVFALKYLIDKYDAWEDKFLAVIRIAMETSFDIKSLEENFDVNATVTQDEYKIEVLKCPYILIRFISAFFMDQDESIFGERELSAVDHQRMVDIGEKLQLHKLPVFNHFCKTFTIT
jgi:hypothetical protein